jgi:DNA-binding GntR family transcriptional regulator
MSRTQTAAQRARRGPETEHGERREYVATAIAEGIVAGKFRAGDRLVAQEIAAALGVSVTPVREALAELTGIGIVDFQPNRGATVHRFSADEIREVGRVRRALECEAVRGAIGRIPPAILRGLHEQIEQLANQPIKGKRLIGLARQLDSQLHDLIARYCGNSYLQRELLRLSRLFRALRDASWIEAEARDDCDRLAEEAREHLVIAKALRRKDRPAAVRAMSQHISSSSRYWSRSAAPRA